MKKILFVFAALLFSGMAISQEINFSGNWKLNNTKSQLNDQFSLAPLEIIIVHNGNDLSVEKHSDFQGQAVTTNDKLTLDGKECINPGFMDSQKKSVVNWSDDKQSLKIVSTIPLDDGDMTITEVYKIDGDNLVIASSASSSYGELSETMVYDKQ